MVVVLTKTLLSDKSFTESVENIFSDKNISRANLRQSKSLIKIGWILAWLEAKKSEFVWLGVVIFCVNRFRIIGI